MANNFKVWVDTPTPEQQVQSPSAFESDEQRINGFKAGNPASALRVNTALRQANVVVAGLMEFCDEVKTLPDDLSLLSTVTEVKNAIKASFNEWHNTNISGLENALQELQNEVDGKQDALTFDDVPTEGSNNPVKSEGIKSYVDSAIADTESSVVYDLVIRTQEDFIDMITDGVGLTGDTATDNANIQSSTWKGAKSVALIGQFTLSTTDNCGIKIPSTVKQIHGFNSAKITVTNFKFNVDTAKGGLWYDTLPTTPDYSIRDLEVDCTGTAGYGFRYCTNLTNCTGTGTGTAEAGFGFRDCTNLTNCTGTGTGSGTATGSGFGFYSITYASNCRDGGSSTAMWGGANFNIDLDTCCKTPVEADNTTLNT